MSRLIFSVHQINEYVRNLLNRDPILQEIWVRGEISNLKIHTSGHIYFTLKDQNSRIRCVLFRQYKMNLQFLPADGMKVLVKGQISLYSRDGQYQIYVLDMEKDGIGDLYEAFEAMKKRLKEEGLFAPEHKKPIPPYPKKIAVITSPTGAAVRDIINVVHRRYPCVDILVVPVLVQGHAAPKQIEAALDYVNTRDDIDTVILGRGGGSLEELWAFNEEIVARAIFQSDIPVISAVGHETDFTIADFVADLRAPTPSAAAELAVPLLKDLRLRVHIAYKTLNHLMEDKIYSELEKLKKINQSVPFRKPLDRIYKKQQDLDSLEKILNNSMKHILEKKRSQFGKEIKALEALSPLNTLLRGYSITLSKEGRNISSIGDVKVEDAIYIKLKDGIIDAVVKGIQEDEEGFDG